MNYKYLFHAVLACLIISALPVFAEISPAYLRIGSSMEDSVLVEVLTSGVKVASDIESLEEAEIKPVKLMSNSVSCPAFDLAPTGRDNLFDRKVSILLISVKGRQPHIRLRFEGTYKEAEDKWLVDSIVPLSPKSVQPAQTPEKACLAKVPQEGRATIKLRTAVNKKDKSKIDIVANLFIDGQKILKFFKNGKKVKITARLKNPAGQIVSEQVKDLRDFGYL